MTEHEWPQPYRLLDAEPYWAALEEERLTFQRCGSCGDVVWPAHSYCPHCSSPSLAWEESRGHGEVWSYSTVMRGPTPAWASIAPYTVGFVRLDEGYYLFSQIEADPDAVAIGMPVEVRFVRRGQQTLPVFAPAVGG
ncbi:Zn-ribbon domain-containing OB-fold protein [Saccharopolyspora tripterygii]